MPDTATLSAKPPLLDRLFANYGPDRPPIRAGRACGLIYAVWQMHPSSRARPYRLFVMAGGGQIIDGQEPARYIQGHRVVPYHSLRSVRDAERRCLRLHLRHRTGRHALSLPVVQRPCKEAKRLLREARGRDAKRSNRRAEERGEYMPGDRRWQVWSRLTSLAAKWA
jgi:hypothetical protein